MSRLVPLGLEGVLGDVLLSVARNIAIARSDRGTLEYPKSVIIWLAGVGIREGSVSAPLGSGGAVGDVLLSVSRNSAIARSDRGALEHQR